MPNDFRVDEGGTTLKHLVTHTDKIASYEFLSSERQLKYGVGQIVNLSFSLHILMLVLLGIIYRYSY